MILSIKCPECGSWNIDEVEKVEFEDVNSGWGFTFRCYKCKKVWLEFWCTVKVLPDMPFADGGVGQ